MTDREQYSDELLNAYADGELASDDRQEIERAMQQDSVLRERFQEIESLKKLVRGAYMDEVASRAAPSLPGRWMPALAASLAAFALGVTLTWGFLSHTSGPTGEQVASSPGVDEGASARTESSIKVVFHLSRNDPVQLTDMLNEAEALLTATAQRERAAMVRIIVSGSGLALFEKGSASEAARISQLKQNYRDQLVFNGCGVAYKQFKNRESDGEFKLLPEMQLVDLGVLELMRRQRQGWAYIRL